MDPHEGKRDIEWKVVRCVGTPEERLREDGLRALRAIRFAVTLGFEIEPGLWAALQEPYCHILVVQVSPERIREELLKAFQADTRKTLTLLAESGLDYVTFRDGLWLRPTLEKV